MTKRLLIIFLMQICFCTLFAQEYTTKTIPNPKTYCKDCYVSDNANVLSAQTIAYLNKELSMIESTTNAEITIVIVPSIGNNEASEFAYNLATYWGVGKTGVNNGVLWLYVVEQRAMHFATGYGVEGILPDAFLSNILQENVFPLMRKNLVDDAFTSGIKAITTRMLDESNLEELLLKTNNTRTTIVNYIIGYFILSLIVFILYLWFLYSKINSLNGDRNIKYVTLSHDLVFTKILGIIFFFPNFFLYLYLKKYRRLLRVNPIDCHCCGAKMRLLSEVEEDAYLDKPKQNEEKISSVDYDVWLCESCFAHNIIPYVNIQTNYTKCPICNARAYSLVSKRILIEASTHNAGKGQEEYQCRSCKYMKHVPFTIPQIVVPPIIIGSSGGNFRGPGGFSGGSFGGGSFGGGGAGGRF